MNVQQRLYSLLACASLVLLGLTSAAAADGTSVDATGKWSWEFVSPNGDLRNTSVLLKTEGDKLTGKVVSKGQPDAPIESITLQTNHISFRIVREVNKRKFISDYDGVIEGDQIKGKWVFNRDGDTSTRDWEARRGDNVTGTWRYTLVTGSGQSIDPVLRLRQKGKEITGKVIYNQNEVEITNGVWNDGKLSFEANRERDGRVLASKYEGRLDDGVIKGKIHSNWSGYEKEYDFEARQGQ